MRDVRKVFVHLVMAACAAEVLTACASGGDPVPAPALFGVVEGMQSPESAIFDVASKTWFISNIVASAPGDGFIARVDADGNLLDPTFATGLDDPKGLAIVGRTLYVVDVQRLVAIPIDAPNTRDAIPIPDSVFLNDVSADPAGDLYVSDTFGNAVFRVHQGEAKTLIRDPRLESPNGLYVAAGVLWIASIGPDLNPQTFEPSQPGRILRFEIANGTLSEFTERFGTLDGLVRDGDSFLASDFARGVYVVDASGTPTMVIDNAATGWKSAADIGFDPLGRRLAVPEVFGTRVGIFELH